MTVAIALHNPKYARNVAAVLRSASAYGVERVLYSGERVTEDLDNAKRLPREERMREYGDVEFDIEGTDRLFDATKGLVPVAIELTRGAQSLPLFEHPENAVYVFGPEDGGLGRAQLGQCHYFVQIPTNTCLNLAVAVSTVLYDRIAKQALAGQEVPWREEWVPRSHKLTRQEFADAVG